MTEIALFVIAFWALVTLLLALAAQYVLALFGVHAPLVVVVLGIVVIRALLPSRSS